MSSVTRCCDVAGRQSADTRTPVFVSPWWRGAAAGGAAAAAGGRGGGVSRLGGGGAGEGILTTKYKIMKLIDGRTEIDQAFTVRILTWFCCKLSPPDRVRISPPAPLCQEGVPSLSIKQRGARQARPGQTRPARCCRLPSPPSRSQDTRHSSFFNMF